MARKNKDILFVEKVLRNLKSTKAEYSNLVTALKLIESDKLEAVEGENLKASVISDMPRNSYFGSKHFKIENTETKLLEQKEELIKKRMDYLDALLRAVEESLSSISAKDRKLVTDFYVERRTLIALSQEWGSSYDVMYVKKRGLIVYLSKSLHMFNPII